MLLALDGTAITVAAITTIGAMSVGFFGYLGLKSQVKKTGLAVADQVAHLDSLNTSQHGENARLLTRMLDSIAEQGVMIASVVDVQNYPIIKTDPRGSLIQINAAGSKLIGMSITELVGNGWVSAIHPDDRIMVFNAWAEAVKTKRQFGPISYRYVHPATKVVTLVEAVANPVIGGIDGKVLSWVAVVVPISGLNEAMAHKGVSHEQAS